MVNVVKKYVIKPQGIPENIYKSLDAEQLNAVLNARGRSIVVAGPGSGKTRVITYKIAHLIHQGVKPSEILLVTFTRAASKEMIERAKTVTGKDLSDMLAGTFHHVCNVFLRKYAPLVGLDRNYTIIDREDSESLVRHARSKILEKMGRELRKYFPQPSVLMSIFSYMKNTLKTLKESIITHNPKFLELEPQISEIYEEYSKEKLNQNLLDYDDLLIYALKLFEENDGIRMREARRFKWILVDEFQDTNYVQYKLIEILASEGGNVMVVGDDAQSIYSFRGARYENVEDFMKIPGTMVFRIQTNYRSTEKLVDFINHMLPRRSVPKELRAVRRNGFKPVVVETWDRYEEAHFVVQRIMDHIENGVKPGDIAVLYRSHSHSFEIQMELSRLGVPYRILSGPRFTETAHVKDVLAFLRIVHNPKDKPAWIRASKLFYGVGDRTASKIADSVVAAIDEGLEPFETMLHIQTTRTSDLSKFKEIVMKIKDIRKPHSILKVIYEDFYAEYLENTYPDFRERRMDVERLMDIAERYESIEKFLTDLSISETVDIQRMVEERDEKITLTTVHQAKGLEWKVVFVISVNPGDFPNGMAIMEGNLDEEERIFYVAITRAKDFLYISHQISGSPYPFRGNRFIMRRGGDEDFVARIPEELVERWEVTWENGRDD